MKTGTKARIGPANAGANAAAKARSPRVGKAAAKAATARVKIVDHILIPYNGRLMKDLFFENRTTEAQDIYYKGEKIAGQYVSDDLKQALEAVGFKFNPRTVNRLYSRRMVFGVRVNIQKNWEDDVNKAKAKIKEVVIAINSSTQKEANVKRDAIVNALEDKFPGIKLQVAVSDKVINC